MNTILMLWLLLLLPAVVSAMTSAKVVSYSKIEQRGSLMCAMEVPDETISASSLKDCSLSCALGDICSGFNTKDSLTCDHVMSPVLASTPRTLSPVMCTMINRLSSHLSQDALSTRLLQ